MKVFVGSASESKATVEWIAALISESGHEVLPWYDARAFPAGKITLHRLIEISTEVDAAVFVFSEDDTTLSRGIKHLQPRDNVVLEFGLFAGVLGPERAIICAAGEPKLPVDAAGVTVINVSKQYAATPRLNEWLKSLNSRVIEDPEEISVGYLKQSEHVRFTRRIGDRLIEASKIVMMGSGVAILGRPLVVEQLMRRAAEGKCTVEIYLANPYSPAVEVRLIEEEQGLPLPPDGKPGLLARLDMLLSAWRAVKCPPSVKINICTQYPTFALVIVDDDYYVYPYAYKRLGNFSPVFVFSKRAAEHDDIVRFFDDHYARTKADALDAQQVLSPANASREGLRAFAVFFVPPRDSGLYRFGTQVLGYDVHGRSSAETTWRTQTGRASEFGFHLTICDALYFYNEAEVRKAVAEVSYLVRDFGPFELRDLRLEFGCPNPNSIAITARDLSGQLESLHHEFVQRIYRRAAASDYTFGRAELDRSTSSGRSRFIMDRYHAPYILSEFRPHFTLLSDCIPPGTDEDHRRLKELFETEVTERVIVVDRLAIMARFSPQEPWSIAQSVKLGRA